ncbi:MAG TPA: copper resistance protein NlpE N-terminal domain-containing protein [Bacteroidia bacterium]|nr:copper resistance protein NlpE N-terminal domain-containing protein [Bacteroidia bacterium]
MKTNAKIALAALLIASFAFDACKKGEGDPFLSLKSRKSRMAGDWKYSAGSGTDFNGSNTSTSWTYDGTTKTSIQTISGFSPVTSKTNIAKTIKIQKDGTYTLEDITTDTSNITTYTEKGIWNFTAGIGDDKKKDHLVLRPLSETTLNTSPPTSSMTTYTGDDSPTEIFYIYQLKSKEVILKWDGSTQSGTSTASSSKGEWTLTQ